MNEFVKIRDDIDKESAKEIKKLLLRYKKSQKRMIEEIAAVIIQNMDDDGVIIMSPSLVVEIQDDIKKNLDKLTTDEKAFMDDVLEKAYKTAYDGTASTIGYKANWKILRPEIIATAIAAPIAGETYSQRIWDNVNDLANRIYNDIIDCVRNGKRPSEIARKIKNDFGVSAYQANRLVNTELAKVVNKAQLQIYEESGVVDKVMWTATLEKNTCEYCADLDGKKFDLGKAPFLPAHPNCRCCLVPVVGNWKPTSRADNETKENIKYKTYNEWQNAN